MQDLRSRFDGGPFGQLGDGEIEGSDADESSDYFGHALTIDHRVSVLPGSLGIKTPKATTRVLPPVDFSESPLGPDASEVGLRTPGIGIRTNSRNYVNPGDLHSMAGADSGAPRASLVYSISHDSSSKHGNASRRRSLSATRSGVAGHLDVGDFDLREEVMSCIAKSIGLIQPPHLGHGESESEAERSPGVLPFSSSSSDAGGGPSTTMNSSFGSLSMLEVDVGVGDDASSTSASATGLASRPLLGLDNEVEILSFDAGSTLVMAGERNAGLFFFSM